MAVAARLRRRAAGAPVRAQRCGARGPRPAARGRPGAAAGPQPQRRRARGRGPAPAGALNLLIDQAWQAVHGPHCKAALSAAVRRLDATVPEFYRLPLGTALVLAAAFRASRAWYARAGPRVEKRVLAAMGAQDTDGLEVAFADSCLGQVWGPLALLSLGGILARKMITYGWSGPIYKYLTGLNGCLMDKLNFVQLVLWTAVGWWLLSSIQAIYKLFLGCECADSVSVARVSRTKSYVEGGVLFFCTIFFMEAAGLPFSSIYASLGFLTIALGLASQDFARNLLGGLQILLYRPFGVGDSVKFGKVSGKAVNIGVLKTEIRGPNRELVYVPNSTFISATVTNLTRSTHYVLRYKLNVAYTPEVLPELAKMSDEIRRTLAGKPAIGSPAKAYYSQLSEAGVVLEVEAVVDKTLPASELAPLREQTLLEVIGIVNARGGELVFPAPFVQEQK